jgi:hypothetical protein
LIFKGGEKMKENDSKYPSIYIQAVIAVLLVNLVHKFVREIPGSISQMGQQGTIGGVVTIITAIIIAISILLLLFKRKEGVILGIIPAIWAMVQWIINHVIWANPDINGIWWYPIFPVIQGLLIIYFSILAWRNEISFNK